MTFFPLNYDFILKTFKNYYSLPTLILFLSISLIVILLNKVLLYLLYLNNLIIFNFDKKYLYIISKYKIIFCFCFHSYFYFCFLRSTSLKILTKRAQYLCTYRSCCSSWSSNPPLWLSNIFLVNWGKKGNETNQKTNSDLILTKPRPSAKRRS